MCYGSQFGRSVRDRPFFLLHNPVHECSDTVPDLYVDLVSIPHKHLGPSDEPDARRCASENDRAVCRRVRDLVKEGRPGSATYPGCKVVPCERKAMILATPKIMCLHCRVSVDGLPLNIP